MKILIIGSSKKEKMIHFKKEAKILGKILAEKNHTIMSGGGAGTFKLVFKSYKSNNGKNILYI